MTRIPALISIGICSILWWMQCTNALVQPTVSSQLLPSILTNDPTILQDQQYDYIIVGAGLSGMVLASRLSEDYSKKILLIEAGNDTRRDPRVRTLRLDNEALWWNIETRQQKDGSSRNHSLGIGLGGSTSINGAKVDGPQAGQIDVFRKFGNPSWNWNRIMKYMKKSQNYQGPGEIVKELGATWQDDGHGIHGPVDISFSHHSYTGFPQSTFIEALNQTMKVEKIIDAGTGDGNGIAYCPHFIKHGSFNSRESSATAYYDPIEYERSNLHILTGWRGIRVNWERVETAESATPSFWSSWQHQNKNKQEPISLDNDKGLRAASVTIQSRVDGETFDMTLSADIHSEVILSSGALITPLVLELSGIGDKEIISKIEVIPRIDLPGVGRNLVEKATNIVVANGRNTSLSHATGGPLPAVAMLSIDKITDNVTEVREYVEANIQKWAEEVVETGGAANLKGILKQFQVTIKGIFEEKWPVAEWEYFSKNEVAIKAISLLPWSRGFIHSKTNNSIWNIQSEDIDLHPQFWSRSLDLDIQIQSLRRARRVLASPQMKAVAGEEIFPGDQVATSEEDGDFSQWQMYVLNTYGNIGHNMGTAAMMSRHLGGVVNEEFKVYGTSNLRIVDASIFPMQISAHPAATLFGIAEMAADVIRQNSSP